MDGGSGSTANMKDSTSCQQDPSEQVQFPVTKRLKESFFFRSFVDQ